MRRNPKLIVAVAAIAVGCVALSTAAEASTLKTLYTFCSQPNCTDGVHPVDSVTLGTDGTIYGVTYSASTNPNGGTVFALVPNARKSKYKFKQLHVFCLSSCLDGQGPTGRLVIDTAGNLYGATSLGGTNGFGVVFELMPRGVKWKFKVLYEFCPSLDCSGGSAPTGLSYKGQASGQPYDGISPLYGVTSFGGKNDKGGIFTLTPVNGKWKERAITSFDQPAFDPSGPPSIDPQGKVFAPTSAPFEAGAVTESSSKNGRKWMLQTVYIFGGGNDGQDPSGALAFDDQNRIFGTTQHGGNPTYQPGDIYRLTLNGSA